MLGSIQYNLPASHTHLAPAAPPPAQHTLIIHTFQRGLIRAPRDDGPYNIEPSRDPLAPPPPMRPFPPHNSTSYSWLLFVAPAEPSNLTASHLSSRLHPTCLAGYVYRFPFERVEWVHDISNLGLGFRTAEMAIGSLGDNGLDALEACCKVAQGRSTESKEWVLKVLQEMRVRGYLTAGVTAASVREGLKMHGGRLEPRWMNEQRDRRFRTGSELLDLIVQELGEDEDEDEDEAQLLEEMFDDWEARQM
ncbi:hypothetical protein EDC01DRAFT_251966 [Geopyxis carbonaria]|nr:hypothetical protein EDC01DRAFT_251966 [Geopyxis carbonaria]